MSQSSDVFRTMTPEECEALVRGMRESTRPLYKQMENQAAATLRLRPVFLGKQPLPKRCEMIRKAMALKVNGDAASELLAAYFMNAHQKDVEEMLDLFGVKHEEGVLSEDAPAPPTDAKIKKAVKEFRTGENALLRGVLLKAFAAQSVIEWPTLDGILFAETATTGETK